MLTLGENLTAIRESQGLTRVRLAEMLNMSKYTLRSWEYDRYKPNIDQLIMISNALGVTLDRLVKCEEDDNVNNNDKMIIINDYIEEYTKDIKLICKRDR